MKLILPIFLSVSLLGFSLAGRAGEETVWKAHPEAAELDRSPVDCVLTPDERWLISANQTSGTVSVVDLKSGYVASEVPCGPRPSAVVLTPNGKRLLASAAFSHELIAYDLDGSGQLKEAKRRWLGFEPRGIVIDAAGKLAYVALTTAHAVAV